MAPINSKTTTHSPSPVPIEESHLESSEPNNGSSPMIARRRTKSSPPVTATSFLDSPLSSNQLFGIRRLASDAVLSLGRKRLRPELVTIHEAQPHLRDGAGLISKGYRQQLSFIECLESLFFIHNQFCNAWSMILGIFSSYRLYSYYSSLVSASITSFPHLRQQIEDLQGWKPLLAIWLSCLVHAPVSASYHCLRPYSPQVFNLLKRMDFMLIFVSASIAFYGDAFFILSSELRFLNHSLVILGSCCSVYWASTGGFIKSAVVSRGAQLGCVAMVMVFFTIPFFYELFTVKHLAELIDPSTTACWCFLFHLSLASGGFFFGSRFPEKYIPGVFDHWVSE
jgi:adiponectin receptor